MRIRSTVPFILLLLYSVSPLSGQPVLNFETIQTTGSSPAVDLKLTIPENEISGFAIDPIGQVVHWVYRNEWYRLNLQTREWSRHAIRNGFDLDRPRWDVVPGKLELRAWDSGIGRVFRIDSNGIPTRIDQSFDQKTQFGHLQHMDETGAIYAIGGDGLHHTKNYAIVYSNVTGGWHRIEGRDMISSNPYIISGHVLKDPFSRQLLLITGYLLHEGHTARGILQLNQETGTVRILHPSHTGVGYVQYGSFTHLYSSTVRTGSQRIGFIQQPRPSNQTDIFQITAIDLDTHRITELTGPISSDIHRGTLHLMLHYDETDSTLYSLQWTHHSAESISVPIVQKARIDVDGVKALLAKGIPPQKPDTGNRGTTSAWPWQLAFMITLIGLFLVWIRSKRPASIHTPSSPSDKLLICPDPLLLNGRTWEDLFDGNYPLEAQLLTLLAKAAENGNPIVSSDTIDRVLIPNHPSPDFIRKIRNQTRKRLEESLQSLMPTSDSQPYILIDRDVLDKRKTKLQLNLAVVELTPPG